jgi:hypothetical protein
MMNMQETLKDVDAADEHNLNQANKSIRLWHQQGWPLTGRNRFGDFRLTPDEGLIVI